MSRIRSSASRRLSGLMTSSALGGALMLTLSATPAVANDECGPGAPGTTVVCTTADGPYGAIAYENARDLTLEIEAGAEVANGVNLTGDGALTIRADGASIHGEDGNAIAVWSTGSSTVTAGAVTASGGTTAVYVYGDSIDVSVESVTTTGNDTSAVYLGGGFGGVTGEFGAISTSGDQALGIGGHAQGDSVISVAFDTVSTNGSQSGGVSLLSDNGIVVGGRTASGERRGVVSTRGARSHGVEAEARGAVTIELEGVETHGDDSTAVVADGTDVTVDIGELSTHGDQSDGLRVYSDLANITVDRVITRGEHSHGVNIGSANGGVIDLGEVVTEGFGSDGVVFHDGTFVPFAGDAPASLEIDVDSVRTSGPMSRGIVVETQREELDISLNAGSVYTHSYSSTGISVAANGNSLSITAGSVETRGGDSAGILVTDGREVIIRADEVTTRGEESAGIKVGTTTGANVDIEVGSVTLTGGRQAAGIEVTTGEPGVVRIVADSVSTTGTSTGGSRSHGVVVNNGGETTLDIGSVSTTENNSAGVRVIGGGGDITIDLGQVTTQRRSSTGVDIYAEGAALALNVDSVTTGDANSAGIRIEGAGDTTLTAGTVRTAGTESHGLQYVATAGSEVLLDIDDIATTGEGANGVDIELMELGETARVELRSSGLISTTGDEAHGVEARGYGDLVLDLNDVSTTGERASGVHLDVFDTASVGVGGVITTGDEAFGLSIAGRSMLTLDVGSVTTSGAGAGGVLAHGIAIGGRIGSITTEGDGATALEATAEDDLAIEIDRVRTSGEGSLGVTLIAQSGSVEALIGDVETEGDDSGAIILDANDDVLLNADEDLDLASLRVVTHGDRSVGVDIFADYLATVRMGLVHTAGDSAAGMQVRGSTVTAEIGDVLTEGEGSDGVSLEAWNDVTLAAGRIVTQGADSNALYVSSQRDSEISIEAIQTSGDDALGMEIIAGGDVVLESGVIRTAGDRSSGAVVSAVGTITAGFDEIRTSGTEAYGLHLSGEGDVNLELGLVDVSGSGSTGVFAMAEGELTASIARGVSAADGVAVEMDSVGALSLTIGQGAVVRGGEAGVRLSSDTSTSLVINGTISAASGPAIDIKGGAAVIDNLSNTIVGHIDLTANDDVLNNAGRFTAGGLSDFGDGNDVLNNTGLINLVEATTPRTATFVGLERLNNAGVIGLANGVAQDIFTIDGILNGQAGNRVELDLDLRGATPLADHIAAGGFEGLTNIVLNVQGRAALGDTGVVVARSGMVQTGAELDVTVAQGGFVNFDLLFANGEYRLNGDLAPPAFEPTKVATGAQHQWTSGADVVSARFEQMSDGGRRGDRGDQVWAQIYGGSNDIEVKRSFDVFGETLNADLSHEVKSQGVQAGVDRALALESADLTFGMLAGAGRTELRFQNGDETRYDGVGVGAYGHWISGPLSVGVLAKLDTFKLDYDWAEANLKTRSDGFTVGARVDAAWRMTMGEAWYVEPQASLSWSDTSLGRMKARDGNEVVFGDTSSLIGRIGVRAGAEMTVGEGLSFRPYAAAHVLNEFDGDNVSTLLLADEAVRVADRAHGAWGRAVLGASLDAPSGLGGFIQAEGDFGKVEGFTARAGVKFSW